MKLSMMWDKWAVSAFFPSHSFNCSDLCIFSIAATSCFPLYVGFEILHFAMIHDNSNVVQMTLRFANHDSLVCFTYCRVEQLHVVLQLADI